MHLGFCHWCVYLLKSITNIIARSRNRNIAIIKTRTTRFNSDWNKGWGIASSTSTASQKNSHPKKFRPTSTLVYQKLRPPKKLRPTRSMLEILVRHWTLPDQILKMSGQLYIMIHHDDWKSPWAVHLESSICQNNVWPKGRFERAYSMKITLNNRTTNVQKKYGKMKSVFLVSDWKCKLKYTWTFPWILQISME